MLMMHTAQMFLYNYILWVCKKWEFKKQVLSALDVNVRSNGQLITRAFSQLLGCRGGVTPFIQLGIPSDEIGGVSISAEVMNVWVYTDIFQNGWVLYIKLQLLPTRSESLFFLINSENALLFSVKVQLKYCLHLVRMQQFLSCLLDLLSVINLPNKMLETTHKAQNFKSRDFKHFT